MPGGVDKADFALADMRAYGHPDFTKVGPALDELGRAESLVGKDKRFLFYFSNETGYRHFDPDRVGVDRQAAERTLKATFPCYEDYARARAITLRFKVENVMRSERFASEPQRPAFRARHVSGCVTPPTVATRGSTPSRSSRTWSTKSPCGRPSILRGENVLEVTPERLIADLPGKINLVEVELSVSYA